MKTIVEINSINYSSTGNIALNIAKEARKQGYKVYTACKKSKVGLKFKYDDQIYIGTRLERIISEELAYITGYKDYFNIIGTHLFIKKLKKIKPDLIHLHSLTDTYINLGMLCKYIKRNNIPVIYTFHDYWAITGQCFFCDYINCQKWKTGCGKCPQLHREPASLIFDRTNHLWKRKNKLFNDIDNLTIVTPSSWLSNITKQSFLKHKDIMVINNGIDLQIFKPCESDFRKKHNLQNKYVVLGVAAKWAPRKGLEIFIELSKRLPDNYKIVLVGTNEEIDKKLPDNILSIHKTFNQQELAEIYSAADLFATPTYEDNFPTVEIEALACGTPVLSFDTGGAKEIFDNKSGSVVNKGDIDKFEIEIKRICQNHPYSKKDCTNRARNFDMQNKFKEYIDLFSLKINK